MKRTNEEAMRYAKATLEMEGLIVTEEGEKLVRDALEGKITHEKFIELLLELVQEKKKK
ncbi:MAG: antitoxin VbhA family protein [Bacillus sp. (in: Bacteria)]|nr:antitoxin VbhA family protein [Bacillus sp. (in: firmicutes)]